MLSDNAQCEAEEVAAVFRTVVIGVVSATFAAVVLCGLGSRTLFFELHRL